MSRMVVGFVRAGGRSVLDPILTEGIRFGIGLTFSTSLLQPKTNVLKPLVASASGHWTALLIEPRTPWLG